MAELLEYNGAVYRVVETSPSQKYILAQKADYPETGRMGVFMDAPIDLFRVVEGQAEYIDYTSCPYDTLDNPFLSDVLWFEEEGFVKLRFRAMELMETQGSRIFFEKKNRRQ